LNHILPKAKLPGNIIVWTGCGNNVVRGRSGKSGKWTRGKTIIVRKNDAAIGVKASSMQLWSREKRHNRTPDKAGKHLGLLWRKSCERRCSVVPPKKQKRVYLGKSPQLEGDHPTNEILPITYSPSLSQEHAAPLGEVSSVPVECTVYERPTISQIYMERWTLGQYYKHQREARTKEVIPDDIGPAYHIVHARREFR
jgi:hypothetical protein